MASIGRRIEHDPEGQPMMVLYRKSFPDGTKCCIPLRDIHLYSEDHNPFFEDQMVKIVHAIYLHLGVGRGLIVGKQSIARQMAEIATVIEGGIDDLLNTPPAEPGKGRVVNEGKAIVNEDTEINIEHTEDGEVYAY